MNQIQNKWAILFLLTFFVILISINLVYASRLPVVGSDNSTWGIILNDYLITLAGPNATLLNQTMVNGTNIYYSSINTTHLIDGTITDEDISDDINLTLGQKITFTFGEIIDNIIDNWIRVTGNLNVTENILSSENITADYFFGNGSQLIGISAGNISWNQSHANTIYSEIIWAYNQTTPAIAYIDAALVASNDSWSSTYNATYDIWAYNQTQGVSVNDTQFDFNDPITIKTSWLIDFFDEFYCKLTGCELRGNIDMNENNITKIKKSTYVNESYGIWSNSTDIVLGYIGGL